MEFRAGLTDTQSWHLLKNMKLAHLSKETKTVEVAMGCGALYRVSKKIANISQGCRRFLTISDPRSDQPISDIFI